MLKLESRGGRATKAGMHHISGSNCACTSKTVSFVMLVQRKLTKREPQLPSALGFAHCY